MKYLAIIGSAILLASCTSSKKPDYTILEGTISGAPVEKMKLVGADFEREILVDKAGTFHDTLHLNNDGFYELYFNSESIGTYLEKGKSLSLKFVNGRLEETLMFSGEMGDFNNFLLKKSQWGQGRMEMPLLFSLEENEFINALEKDRKSLDSLYKANKISKEHREALEKEDRFYAANLVENYQNAHAYYNKKPDFKPSPKLYDYIKDIKFNDTTAFRKSLTYRELVEAHWMRITEQEVSSDNEGFTAQYLKNIDKEFPNGYAKDRLMFNHLKYWLSPNDFLNESVAIYEQSNPDPKNWEEISERHKILIEVMPGKDSPSFTYENFKGGTTSLEDLRGKYVYIDVWATWCGPCLREIPSLKKFEEDYQGKNIQVVSISIDKEGDYQKWRNMVKDRELGGIQLVADKDWKSDFVTKYGIMGIPRFILLDPQGKIVLPDAFRPSDPKLRDFVDTLL